MLNKKKNKKGFTLVELLVVIAIIGILAVVAVPSLFSNINKAKVADLQADYNAFKSASLSYYTDENTYPASTSALNDYMESVPAKSPLSSTGTYDIKTITVNASGTAGSKSLVLISDKNEISEKQAKKLKDELGDAVGIVSNNKFTAATDDGANLKGTDKTIGLVLIKNIAAK